MRRNLFLDLLLIAILLLGAYFRVVGLDWGENQYLHPDERFLIWVGSDITPLKCEDPAIPVAACPPERTRWITLAEYFNTAESPLNPHNYPTFPLYVYGTLPMFLARFVAQWTFGHSGFPEMTQVGRSLSALVDLGSVLLVYLLAARLYNRRVGLLAAAFSAAAVMQIQQSHFFTMDTFVTFFTVLAIYFAVQVIPPPRDRNANGPAVPPSPNLFGSVIGSPLFLPSLGFGLALGMAVASKLNAFPVAVVLPGAMLVALSALPAEERRPWAVRAFSYLVLAALVSLLVFRIFQPYAFSGPGFFDLQPSERWLANLRELRALGSADSDYPPAMQWARRPVWFAGKNLILWGLGLPLGLLAWAGFLWAGVRMLIRHHEWQRHEWQRHEWRSHILIWVWTLFYFVWQSLSLTPSMRYQLLVYPTLAIFAAWAVIHWVDSSRWGGEGRPHRSLLSLLKRATPVVVGGVVLLLTFAWAFAFTRIYNRPVTRIAATRWIYQNIPGPINLRIGTETGLSQQPIPFPYGYQISPGVPYVANFTPNTSGTLSEILLPHIRDIQANGEPRTLVLTISTEPNGESELAAAKLTGDLSAQEGTLGQAHTLILDRPVALVEGQAYYLRLALEGQPAPAVLEGEAMARIQALDGSLFDQPLADPVHISQPGLPYSIHFSPSLDGTLTDITLNNPSGSAEDWAAAQLKLTLAAPRDGQESLETNLTLVENLGGQSLRFALAEPFPLITSEDFFLSLEMLPRGGAISLSGAGLANEGDWDDALPLRMDSYDGFGGIYPLDLNFNMYWDDTPEKLDRFTRILDAAEYIVITSSRQWGSLPRLPERFPMTTVYYRELLGCPTERTIEWCYSVARPGDFRGSLGYELVEIFHSNPNLGPVEINDQFAEEAFTVYDHPKVLVFQKTDRYDSQTVRATLGAVDFSKVIRVPPLRAGAKPANLMLPEDRLAEQSEGGTWADLFDVSSPLNRSGVLAAAVWYLSLALLGWIAYPLVRLALPGLADRGYPLARTAGLLILSYLVWLAGSLRIPFTRPTITAVLMLMVLVGAALGFWQRDFLRREFNARRGYFLTVEGLFLAFFLFDLLIRLGNPDLWHPWKGGERPMDFSYFNAILKSTSFPPFDPWFSGGYLNYYYYGFVFVGVLVKWLGIVPATAYNLILPTLFSLIAMGAFSIGWNLYSDRLRLQRSFRQGVGTGAQSLQSEPSPLSPFWVGLAAAVGTAVLGNLGTVRMIFQGYQRLVAPGGVVDGTNLLTRWVWAIRGLARTLGGESLPYSLGDWYWIPSRAIPAPGEIEPITEFPFFTVLYGDPHAHLFALPITLLALAFALSVVLARFRWRGLPGAAAGFFLGSLAVGALRPTNTWDMPTYLVIAVAALAYAAWCYACPTSTTLRRLAFLSQLSTSSRRSLFALGGAALFTGLAFLLFQPYARWYALGYTQVSLWEGTHTPISAYLTHWGLFLFVIISWMAWETREWMAATPLSVLHRLDPYKNALQVAVLLLLAAILGLLLLGVHIAWLVLPTAVWAGVLLVRPNQPDSKRFVLFLVGSGLILTLAVELIVLRGDIARMNTVFKFYLQVWTLFAVSTAAALGWLLPAVSSWLPAWRNPWRVALTFLAAGAVLYPLMAGAAKIKDRMVPQAPHTLDGMAYMQHAFYDEEWGRMDLSQDYRAIRWLQENIQGSPVIVEANLRNLYRWGSRMTIYTGLPGVAGWEWHQQQQRVVIPAQWITDRILEIDNFYLTPDLEQARAFLRKYDVRYIIVGQQERGYYPGPGLDKFTAAEGALWIEVYQDGETAIYQVVDSIS